MGRGEKGFSEHFDRDGRRIRPASATVRSIKTIDDIYQKYFHLFYVLNQFYMLSWGYIWKLQLSG